ncbi:MAG: thymidylate synthase [Deltaproteobacteria bacterium]|nr:thymidylate synthase [Deltaproteobacteria bacterium]MBW1794871.1 thymidylate synthase [Deltaproteobacteria bacterium]MBW2329530.1 thymidylate synthase [Deltaproteobacteria bacterium]
MNLVSIEARDLPDAWFQCVYEIMDKGHEYVIDHGSYAGQKRLEFDYVTVHIKYPGVHPLIPDIPPSIGIPNPVAEGYIEEYLPYLMTSDKQPNEDYTYGERLAGWSYLALAGGQGPEGDPLKAKVEKLVVNQIEEVIKMYRTRGYGTNQASMTISVPSDIFLNDPPCLRHIDTRIREGKLHFMVYFRSWDLWNGFPANLGGIQLLKEYMAVEIGVEDGEIVAASKGLHLYDYVWELAQLRTMRT